MNRRQLLKAAIAAPAALACLPATASLARPDEVILLPTAARWISRTGGWYTVQFVSFKELRPGDVFQKLQLTDKDLMCISSAPFAKVNAEPYQNSDGVWTVDCDLVKGPLHA